MKICARRATNALHGQRRQSRGEAHEAKMRAEKGEISFVQTTIKRAAERSDFVFNLKAIIRETNENELISDDFEHANEPKSELSGRYIKAVNEIIKFP